MEVIGKVFTGQGRGSFYLSLPGYINLVKENLGINPFPGTLNIHVDPVRADKFLTEIPSKILKGFKESDRKFGDITTYDVKINGIRAFIVRPEKTGYENDVFELISEYGLRETLGLKDGDKVVVKGEK